MKNKNHLKRFCFLSLGNSSSKWQSYTMKLIISHSCKHVQCTSGEERPRNNEMTIWHASIQKNASKAYKIGVLELHW